MRDNVLRYLSEQMPLAWYAPEDVARVLGMRSCVAGSIMRYLFLDGHLERSQRYVKATGGGSRLQRVYRVPERDAV